MGVKGSTSHLSPAPWISSTPLPPLSPAQCPPASCTSSTTSWQRWRGQSRWWSHARSQEKCSLSSSPGKYWLMMKDSEGKVFRSSQWHFKFIILLIFFSFVLYCIVIIIITLWFNTYSIMIISYLWLLRWSPSSSSPCEWSPCDEGNPSLAQSAVQWWSPE